MLQLLLKYQPRLYMKDVIQGQRLRRACCSVTKSHPALFDPMDSSIPCFPVLQYQRSCFLGNTESEDLGPESHNLKGGTSRDLRQNRWSSNSDSNHYPMTLNSQFIPFHHYHSFLLVPMFNPNSSLSLYPHPNIICKI